MSVGYHVLEMCLITKSGKEVGRHSCELDILENVVNPAATIEFGGGPLL